MITPEKAIKLGQAWDCVSTAIKHKLWLIESNNLNLEESLSDVALKHMRKHELDCKEEIDAIFYYWFDDDFFPDLTFNS